MRLYAGMRARLLVLRAKAHHVNCDNSPMTPTRVPLPAPYFLMGSYKVTPAQ